MSYVLSDSICEKQTSLKYEYEVWNILFSLFGHMLLPVRRYESRYIIQHQMHIIIR